MSIQQRTLTVYTLMEKEVQEDLNALQILLKLTHINFPSLRLNLSAFIIYSVIGFHSSFEHAHGQLAYPQRRHHRASFAPVTGQRPFFRRKEVLGLDILS